MLYTLMSISHFQRLVPEIFYSNSNFHSLNIFPLGSYKMLVEEDHWERN